MATVHVSEQTVHETGDDESTTTTGGSSRHLLLAAFLVGMVVAVAFGLSLGAVLLVDLYL